MKKNAEFIALSAKAIETKRMAGLLTYSRFRGLPIGFLNRQWQKFFENAFWSLQQRDCSGFSPDSLLITFP